MNYYERHLGDYARDTAHLSVLEHGVYTLLLDRYYATEQPIPAEQAHRVARARAQDERAAVDAVLGEFFKLVDGAWRNARADAEISRYRDKQEKARRSANARWKPSGGNCGTGADALPAHQPVDANASDQDADALRTRSEGNAHQTPDTITPPRSLRELHPPADAGGVPSADTAPPKPAVPPADPWAALDARPPSPSTDPPPEPPQAAAPPPVDPPRAKAPRRAKAPPHDTGNALPDWIPGAAWAAWIEARRAIRAPLTPKARTLAIAALARLRDAGDDPGAVLEQSALRGWRGLFPLTRDRDHEQTPARSGGRRESLCERVERINREADERDDDREHRAGNVIEHPVLQRLPA